MNRHNYHLERYYYVIVLHFIILQFVIFGVVNLCLRRILLASVRCGFYSHTSVWCEVDLLSIGNLANLMYEISTFVRSYNSDNSPPVSAYICTGNCTKHHKRMVIMTRKQVNKPKWPDCINENVTHCNQGCLIFIFPCSLSLFKFSLQRAMKCTQKKLIYPSMG